MLVIHRLHLAFSSRWGCMATHFRHLTFTLYRYLSLIIFQQARGAHWTVMAAMQAFAASMMQDNSRGANPNSLQSGSTAGRALHEPAEGEENFIAWQMMGCRILGICVRDSSAWPGFSCSAVLGISVGNASPEGEGIHGCITASTTDLCR